MKPTDFSAAEQSAVLKAMTYWVNNWDEECPTLFGMPREAMVVVIEAWPYTALDSDGRAFSAAVGSLRELLFGATSVSDREIEEIMGISRIHAVSLCAAIRKS